MNLIYLRNEIKKLINQNPVTITFTRQNLISDGMDGWIVDPNNPTATVELTTRLYKKNIGIAVVTDAGASYNTENKALFEYNANIRKDDTFTVNNETWKVRNVEPTSYNSEVIKKEAILERVR